LNYAWHHPGVGNILNDIIYNIGDVIKGSLLHPEKSFKRQSYAIGDKRLQIPFSGFVYFYKFSLHEPVLK
jgi:hypothetical protein